MVKIASLFLLLFFGNVLYAQKRHVEIIHDTLPKRINLYATNTTKTSLEVMLIIEGTGFRRSAFKPIIKRIEPNDTIFATTLIPLKKVDFSYSIQVFSDTKFEDVNVKRINAHEKKLKAEKQFSDQKKAKDTVITN